MSPSTTARAGSVTGVSRHCCFCAQERYSGMWLCSRWPPRARLFAVTDVWDALTSDPPYRAAWTREQALAYLHEQTGKHFDLQLVDVFLRMSDEE